MQGRAAGPCIAPTRDFPYRAEIIVELPTDRLPRRLQGIGGRDQRARTDAVREIHVGSFITDTDVPGRMGNTCTLGRWCLRSSSPREPSKYCVRASALARTTYMQHPARQEIR